MHRLTLLFALMFATSTTAAERCGTDDFGNAVCLDKDGVVSSAPPEEGGDGEAGRAASAVAAGKQVSGDRRGDRHVRPRCGIDPFGNKVCR